MSPVKPPAAPVGRGAGAAPWSLVVVPVHGGKRIGVVRGQGVGGVAGVAGDPEAVQVLLILHPASAERAEPVDACRRGTQNVLHN